MLENSSTQKHARNRQPPRPQSSVKQQEIRRQVQEMLDNNVIEPSSATEYSQVHLQPKPEGKWRFCVDLRNLNLASKGRGWPIPNIP